MAIRERNVPENPNPNGGPWDGRLKCVYCGGSNYGHSAVIHEKNCPTRESQEAMYARTLAQRIAADKARDAEEKRKQKEHRDYWDRIHGRK